MKRRFHGLAGLLVGALLCAGRAGSGAEAATVSDAAPFLVKSWKRQDGLPQNSVQAIAQTADGYLWVGTRGGLARFDGVGFKSYGLADGLEGMNIADLLDDGQGGLWIGTFGGGLSRWHDGVVSTLRTVDGLAHDNAMVLARAEPGAVWVGGNGGLQHWGTNGFTRIGAAEGLPEGEVVALVADPQAGVWVATERSGLFLCRGGRCEPVEGPPGLPLLYCYSLLFDGEGDLWVSIGNGRVLRRHAGEWTEYDPSHGLPISFVYCLALGPTGEVWAGTQEEGVRVFRGGRFHPVEAIGDWLGNAIRSIAATRDGLVWIGTQADGLNRLGPVGVVSHPVGSQDRRGRIHGLIEGAPGDFWVATYGGGLFHGPMERLEQVQGVQELVDNPFLLAGLKMKDGTIHVGGVHQLLRIEAGSSQVHVVGAPGVWTAFCEGDDGALWMGSRDGEIKRLVDGVPQQVVQGLPGVSGLVHEAGPTLWIATQGGGLFRWRDGQLRQWRRAEGLPIDVLRVLHKDAEGTLWIGTAGGGLAWMRDERLSFVDSRRGLGDDFITQIHEDDEGRLWLGSHRGILRVAKAELFAVAAGRAEAVHPLVIDEADGMVGAECTGGFSPAGLRDRSGQIQFSTARGVVTVDPKRFGTPAPPPPVRIESLRVDGRTLAAKDASFSLSPGPQEVEIHYTAFNYSKPEQILFRHRLKGLQADWVGAGSQRSARFLLLGPGDYVFEVASANADGIWTDQIGTVAFRVMPLFWQTRWFGVAVAAGLLATGGGVVAAASRSRIRRARLHERFARAEAETQQHRNQVARLTQLATLGELSAALAHELNQPLAAIMSNAQAAQRFLAVEGADPAEIRDILRDIVADDRRASEVIVRVRALLNKDGFHPRPLDVNAEIREALRLMKGELEERGVRLFLELEDLSRPIRGDRVLLQQALINLLLNAADAMDGIPSDRRTLWIRSGPAPEGVLVSVADSGPGVPPGDRERIFAPFHTTKPNGLGLGLSLTRSILRAHGGRLWVENRLRGGAEFSFTLLHWKD